MIHYALYTVYVGRRQPISIASSDRSAVWTRCMAADQRTPSFDVDPATRARPGILTTRIDRDDFSSKGDDVSYTCWQPDLCKN